MLLALLVCAQDWRDGAGFTFGQAARTYGPLMSTHLLEAYEAGALRVHPDAPTSALRWHEDRLLHVDLDAVPLALSFTVTPGGRLDVVEDIATSLTVPATWRAAEGEVRALLRETLRADALAFARREAAVNGWTLDTMHPALASAVDELHGAFKTPWALGALRACVRRADHAGGASGLARHLRNYVRKAKVEGWRVPRVEPHEHPLREVLKVVVPLLGQDPAEEAVPELPLPNPSGPALKA